MKPQRELAATVEAHLPVVRSGLRWVYETEQPDSAVLQHHGEGLPSVANRNVSFCPVGWARHVVVVLAVSKVEYGPGPGCRPENPLARGELEAFAGLLRQLGQRVVKTWNGHPWVSGSVALGRPAHPSLVAAVQRYHAGCPRHGGVFCRCGWYGDGNSDLVGVRTIHAGLDGQRQEAEVGGGVGGDPYSSVMEPKIGGRDADESARSVTR